LGENPKQSRCCNFHSVFTLYATESITWEGCKNRNKSEDLPIVVFYYPRSEEERIIIFMKSIQYCKTLCVLLLSVLHAPCMLLGQSKLDSIQQIEEVVITAQPFKTIIPTQKLSGKKLELLHSRSVADALRYFSGVQIKDYGGMGGLKTVNVRNMGSHYVGTFYDGIKINNEQNGIVDLGKYSLDDLEEIALYHGQKSDIFQSAKDFSVSSGIYLKAKQPHFKEGENTHLRFRYKTGSIQLTNPSLRWEQRINKKLKISVSGEYLQSDGEYKFRYMRKTIEGSVAYDTTATRKNSDIEAIRLEAGLYKSLKNGQWNTRVYYYHSQRGLPGAIVKNKFNYGGRQTDGNFFVQTRFIKEISPDYKLKINAKYANDYLHYLNRGQIEFQGELHTEGKQFDNTFRQEEIYCSLVQLYNLSSSWAISLSTDLQYNKLKAKMVGNFDQFAQPKRYTLMNALSSSFHYGRFKGQASIISQYVDEKTSYKKAAPSKHQWSPSIVLGYQPFAHEKFNIRAYYKNIYRMPSFNDMYYTESGVSLLKPEESHHFNIGISYEKRLRLAYLHRFSWQCDLYYTDIKNKILASPTTSTYRFMMTNLGKVVNKGINTSLQINGGTPQVKVNGLLSYTYSEAKDYSRTPNGDPSTAYGGQIPYAPWHSGSITLDAHYRTWSLNYSFIYVGERYNANQNNIPINHIEPWYTHDLAIQKNFTLGKYHLETSIEVNNLFNQYYDVIYNFPMPGRNLKFIITLSL
jgi:outer membrane cobalamin receptor